MNSEFERRLLDMTLRRHFPSFIYRVFQTVAPGQPYLPNWHIEAIAWYLMQCLTGAINRLIITLPPRSLKSISASVAFPAFALGHDPSRRIICASYSEKLASKHALEALSETLHFELSHFGLRVVIIQPGYIAPGMKHSRDHVGPDVYAELHAQWDGNDAKLTGPAGRPGPEVVAHAVADALEDPATPLRVEVGADAAMVLGLRRTLSDQEFEATMRRALDLTW